VHSSNAKEHVQSYTCELAFATAKYLNCVIYLRNMFIFISYVICRQKTIFSLQDSAFYNYEIIPLVQAAPRIK